MDLNLNAKQKIRINTHAFYDISNFIDVESMNDEMGLKITNYSNSHQYIEIRKKGNQIAMFLFSKKSDKKYSDFGYWQDAEVVFSINEVEHEQ